jgi:hypothetical protein
MFRVISSYILLIFLIMSQTSTIEARDQKYDLPYPKILIKLAKSLSMEPIGGKEFLHSLRTNNGQGLPYVFSEARETQGETDIILCWCQKGAKKYLIYAINEPKEGEEDYNYTVKNIISSSELFDPDYNLDFSYGMMAYDGVLGVTKDLSYFSYLDNPNEHGPQEVYPIRLNGFLPIIIHQVNSVIVLYRYKERWLKYVKVNKGESYAFQPSSKSKKKKRGN